MHEGTQDAHRDIQGVAYHHDEDEGNPTSTAIAQSLQTDSIESLAKFGTGQTQGVQTQVTQHVAEQARGGVVGVP